MLRHTPFGNLPTYKLILGFSLCSLGGALLYAYFKMRDEEEDKNHFSESEFSFQQELILNKGDEKEITMKFTISNDYIPLIMGRRGGNLKFIQNKTGTRIKFSIHDKENKLCEIFGFPSRVWQANEMIFHEIRRAPCVTKIMMVTPKVARTLRNEKVLEISRKSLAMIDVSCGYFDGKNKIQIKGNEKQVNLAEEMLKRHIESAEAYLQVVGDLRPNREQPYKPRRVPNGAEVIYSSQNSIASDMAPEEKLLESRTEEKPMEVYVSAVRSPSQFWLQLVGPQCKKYDDLVKDMSEYYNVAENRGKHIINKPYVGQIVATKQDDKNWYRAEITSDKNGHILDIMLVDTGEESCASISRICELRTDFLTLRFQAVECSLANIKPTKDMDGEWHPSGIAKFEEITEPGNWKKLYARVVSYQDRPDAADYDAPHKAAREGQQVLAIELFEGNECSDELNIAHELIYEGYALPIDSRSTTPTSICSDSTIEDPDRPISPPESPTAMMNVNRNDYRFNVRAKLKELDEKIESISNEKSSTPPFLTYNYDGC